jgi:hypothetical protein
MSMNKLLITVLLSVFLLPVKSQPPFPGPDEIMGFFNSTTLVVNEDQMFSPYNAFIKTAMKEFWEITPFEFISSADFESKRKDPSFSFVVLTQTRYDKDKTGTYYNFINLLAGNERGRIEDMPEICALPLSVTGTSEFEYTDRVGITLRFMQAHAEHLKEDPGVKGKQYLKYYNRFVPELPDKIILVSESDLTEEVLEVQGDSRLFPANMKVVSDEEINSAIRERAPGTVILHKVGPMGDQGGLCFKMLIGTDNGMLYYYGEHKISPRKGNGLLISDLKRVGRF